MSLIIATGSNQGESIQNLILAKKELSKLFSFKAESSIFLSSAVDYTDQPDFYNQVLEFDLPHIDPTQVMDIILKLEHRLGRVRKAQYGPRLIDIDIIFWGLENIQTPNLIAPHPRWEERSFVVKPLQQLPYFQTIKKYFKINNQFSVDAIEQG